MPGDMKDAVDSAREQLFDAVAAADDDLAEKYLEEGTLSEETSAAASRLPSSKASSCLSWRPIQWRMSAVRC